MPSHVIWIPEADACERCRAMAGVQDPSVKRPHRHCRCVIIGKEGPRSGPCLHQANEVTGLGQDGYWQYEPDEGLPTEITMNYHADVLCRTGMFLGIDFSMHYDGQRLQELGDIEEADSQAAMDILEAEALDRAEQLANEQCPDCPRPGV